MTMPTRLAAAAVIGVLAMGGMLYVVGLAPPDNNVANQTTTSSASFPPSGVPTTVAPCSPRRCSRTAGSWWREEARSLLPPPRSTTRQPGPGTATGDQIEARRDATATLLQDGKVLLAGGADGMPGSGWSLVSAELYDPVTGTWASTANMTSTHLYSPMVLLPNGTVLATGGFGFWAASNAELEGRKAGLYDPGSGT